MHIPALLNPIALPDEYIQLCHSLGLCRTYADGEMIHQRGDPKPGLSIVYQGQVKIGNYGADGKYYLTLISGPGETFGEFTLMAKLPRTHTVESYGPSQIIQLNQNAFHRAIDLTPELQTTLFAMMAAKLHIALEVLEDTRRLPVIVRVAKNLLSLFDKTPTATIQITQRDMAQFLGVTELAVHKALRKLSEQALLTLHYGSIRIQNPNAFRSWVNQHTLLGTVMPNKSP